MCRDRGRVLGQGIRSGPYVRSGGFGIPYCLRRSFPGCIEGRFHRVPVSTPHRSLLLSS
jgi:hypothetical protein